MESNLPLKASPFVGRDRKRGGKGDQSQGNPILPPKDLRDTWKATCRSRPRHSWGDTGNVGGEGTNRKRESNPAAQGPSGHLESNLLLKASPFVGRHRKRGGRGRPNVRGNRSCRLKTFGTPGTQPAAQGLAIRGETPETWGERKTNCEGTDLPPMGP